MDRGWTYGSRYAGGVFNENDPSGRCGLFMGTRLKVIDFFLCRKLNDTEQYVCLV